MSWLTLEDPAPALHGGLGFVDVLAALVGTGASIAMPFVAAEQQRKADRKDRQFQEQQQRMLLEHQAAESARRQETQTQLMQQLVGLGALLGGGYLAWSVLTSGSPKRTKTRRRR